MYDFVITTAPTYKVLTLDEIKRWCRVLGTTEHDLLLADLIDAATESVEAWTGRKLITQTITFYPQQFDAELLVPVAPVQSIDSIKYYDLNDTQQTYSSDNYELDTYKAPNRIRAKWDQTWPSVYDRYNPIDVQCVVGYGYSQAVPAALKMAVKALVSIWFDNDTTYLPTKGAGVAQELPFSLRALLGTYRVGHFD